MTGWVHVVQESLIEGLITVQYELRMKRFWLTGGRTVDYHWSTFLMLSQIAPRADLSVSHTKVLQQWDCFLFIEPIRSHDQPLNGVQDYKDGKTHLNPTWKWKHNGAMGKRCVFRTYYTLVWRLQAITNLLFDILMISIFAKCQWINNGQQEDGNSCGFQEFIKKNNLKMFFNSTTLKGNVFTLSSPQPYVSSWAPIDETVETLLPHKSYSTMWKHSARSAEGYSELQ